MGNARGKARLVATLQVSYREERLAVRPIHDRLRRDALGR